MERQSLADWSAGYRKKTLLPVLPAGLPLQVDIIPAARSSLEPAAGRVWKPVK